MSEFQAPNHPRPRTFDVAQGQHPVKWLLETLSFGEGILEALWTWIDEMIPGAIGNPAELNSQAVSRLNFSYFKSATCLPESQTNGAKASKSYHIEIGTLVAPMISPCFN